MKCAACQFDNDDTAKFCEECGAKLVRSCSSCGTELKPTAKFCPECGASITTPKPAQIAPARTPADYTPKHLGDRILAEQAAMEARGAEDGERKTVTSLFADLKGSTALIEDMDPETARGVIDPALQIMMDAVHRYDGYVAQTLGDGIFCLFGAPIAHEDHAHRALFAALLMQGDMRTYSDKVRLEGGPPLLIRIGINTGEVVVRSIRKDDLHTDYVPVGHSTNLAARMEQMAEPGSILVSEYTHRLTEGYFDFKKLGAIEIKGVQEPLDVYEASGTGVLRTRLQVAARSGLTRFVGRHAEMEQLDAAFEMAKTGQGQIVGVMGEPGLGKSRLFHEFKLILGRRCSVFEAFSLSHGQASPYLPIIELLKDYVGIEPQDDTRIRKQKLIGHIFDLDRTLEDTLPYLFALLGIEDPQFSIPPANEQSRREHTFDSIKRVLLRESLNQPLVLLFEDLHWIDTETQGFLDRLIESLPSAPILLLANYRPEYRHDWSQKTYYNHLHLGPLGPEEARELLAFLLGTDSALEPLSAMILERTEGTPFYMEEVVQTLVEENALSGERGNYQLQTAITEVHIPPTVQGILASRIDRLSVDEKALLQQLSVIGREFPMNLVKQIVEQDGSTVRQTLMSLQAKEFIYEQPSLTDVQYIFKHALTQDVAYGTVLQSTRKSLHERIGLAMEEVYRANLEDHYRELAHHFQRAENAEKAVIYLQLAGQQAVRASAHTEAIRCFETALELLENSPGSVQRSRTEFDLQVRLAKPYSIAYGYTSPQNESALLRADKLSLEFENTPQHSAVLFGLHRLYATRGENVKARDIAQQHLDIAQKIGTAQFLLPALAACGAAALWTGEFVESREYFDEVIRQYDVDKHQGISTLISNDPGIVGAAFRARALWSLGYPDQALESANDAIRIAREVDDLHNQTAALGFGKCSIHYFRGENTALAEAAEETIRVTESTGDPFWFIPARILRGFVIAQRGDIASGIGAIQEMMDYQAKIDVAFDIAFYYTVHARVCAIAQRHEDALRIMNLAVAEIERSQGRQHEAEVHRMLGEVSYQFLIEQGFTERARGTAEKYYQKSIEVARSQQARSWELRSATSLAKLWRDEDKDAEARQLLEPVFDWFTEGFETVDLKAANDLLEVVSR